MTPDPLQSDDPWRAWMNDQHAAWRGREEVPVPPAPAWHVPDMRSFQEMAGVPVSSGISGGISLPPLAPSYAAGTQRIEAMTMGPVAAAPTTVLANETANLFGQVQAHRRARTRARRSEGQRDEEPQGQGAVPAAQAAEPRNPRCFQDTCAICLERFGHGDHCCRMQCRHVFHCLCVGEYLQHSTMINERELQLSCPNCREVTTVDVSWVQPLFDLREQDQVTEPGEPREGPLTREEVERQSGRQCPPTMKRHWRSLRLLMATSSHGGQFLGSVLKKKRQLKVQREPSRATTPP